MKLNTAYKLSKYIQGVAWSETLGLFGAFGFADAFFEALGAALAAAIQFFFAFDFFVGH